MDDVDREPENCHRTKNAGCSSDISAILSTWRSIYDHCRASNVNLLVASKGRSSDVLASLYSAGQRHFGENRVDELVAKAKELENLQINWHFIGHLQSNKCRALANVPGLYMVESIDSVKTALELNKALEKAFRTVRVLVQINTTLRNQFGILHDKEDEILEVVKTILRSSKLLFSGLMTIGDGTNECYERLKNVRNTIDALPECRNLPFVMSMGMSHDWGKAIEQGATEVRVGRVIFGE